MSDPPFTVKALFDYTSEHEDDLRFSNRPGDYWLPQWRMRTGTMGEYTDEAGSRSKRNLPAQFCRAVRAYSSAKAKSSCKGEEGGRSGSPASTTCGRDPSCERG